MSSYESFYDQFCCDYATVNNLSISEKLSLLKTFYKEDFLKQMSNTDFPNFTLNGIKLINSYTMKINH